MTRKKFEFGSDPIVRLEELYLAYRKAKVDLYYSSYQRIEDLSHWEKELDKNLRQLQGALNETTQTDYFRSRRFIGHSTYFPKNVEVKEGGSENSAEQSVANPQSSELRFRLLERCSIGFHVLSALWVANVGEKIEATRTSSLYSNYVRRTRSGDYNGVALGTYVPYIRGYKRWRDGAVDAAERLLEKNGEDVVVFTGDISNFYYQLDPAFLDGEPFTELIENLNLTPTQQRVHECFKIALKAWSYGEYGRLSRKIGLSSENGTAHIGLPGGLSASPILADFVLRELDYEIDSQLNPTFYGRYVDDVVLVLRKNQAMTDKESIGNWIVKRVDGLQLESGEGPEWALAYSPAMLEGTGACLRFANRKNKVLILEGAAGRMSLELLKQQMSRTSSEWRLMPVLPASPAAVVAEIDPVSGTLGKSAPRLGLITDLTVHKNSLSRVFRDFEFYARNADNASWLEYRTELYEVAKNTFLQWDRVAEFAAYIPRILRLALGCKDYNSAADLLRFVYEQTKNLECCRWKISGFSHAEGVNEYKSIFKKWRNSLFVELRSIIAGVSPLDIGTRERLALYDALRSLNRVEAGAVSYAHVEPTNLERLTRNFNMNFLTLFVQDMALLPFRESMAPQSTSRLNLREWEKYFNDIGCDPEDLPVILNQAYEAGEVYLDTIVQGIYDFIDAVAGQSENLELKILQKDRRLFGALLLPTRAVFSSQIMSWTAQYSPYTTQVQETQRFQQLVDWVEILRGYNLAKFVDWGRGRFQFREGGGVVCNPEIDVRKNPINIAVVSFKTHNADWERAAWGQPRKSRSRLEQFSVLTNRILEVRENVPNYVLFPELSIPTAWFGEIAYYFAKRGINLIGGVEYQHRGPGKVTNQVWASLVDYSFGFPIHSIYRQDKQKPASGEQRKLSALGNLNLVPDNRYEVPPVIQHGNFRFAVLVCSELTSIKHKAFLRGKIDCLFVTEWNKDIGTFNDLVNAASWDIHAFVVQSNNRQFGDSRIRGPYKERFRRDLVRVRGGLHDHFVVGSIDVRSLRAFQTKADSLSGKFKPTPDGFSMDMLESRKQIPE